MSDRSHRGNKCSSRQSTKYHGTSAIIDARELFGNLGQSDERQSRTHVEFKAYPRIKRTKLPRTIPPRRDLWQLLESRHSSRRFSSMGISLFELSILLRSVGIITATPKGKTARAWDRTRRTYASAGARYPIEVYVALLRGKDIPRGVYHYNIREHSLEALASRLVTDSFVHATGEEWVAKADCAIILAAIFGRSQTKYGERGYRYVLLEAGHIMQNLCLATQTLGLGLCPFGGFVDHEVNALIDVDGYNEAAVYIGFVGVEAPERSDHPRGFDRVVTKD